MRAAKPNLVQRVWIPLLVFALSVSGVAVAADALVVTEREELDGFVDDVTAARFDQRLDGALGYVNPSEVPCRLSIDGHITEFGEGQSAELADAMRGALAVFDSDKQDLLQQSVLVEENHATVTARLGDKSYEQTLIYELVRDRGRWLVRSLRVL